MILAMSEQRQKIEQSVLQAFDNESSEEAEALKLLSGLPDPKAIRDKDKNTLLHKACYNGWLEVIKELIKRLDFDINCKNAYGSSPLHMACIGTLKYGSNNLYTSLTDNEQALLKKGDSAQITHAHANTYLNVVKFLLEEQRCNPVSKDNYGLTPMHSACHIGTLHLVKYFAEEKLCDLACKDNNGRTPLHLACLNGHLRIAKYLVEEKHCNPLCKDKYSCTTMHLACQNGHLEVAKYLIQQKCNPGSANSDGRTSMHLACYEGHLGMVKYLTKEQNVNCDIAHRDINGLTPMHLACQQGHLAVVRYLAEEHSHHTNNYQKNATECEDNDGWTPVHVACKYGHLDVIRYLIEVKHCNPNCRTDDGSMPIHIVSQNGYLRILKYLIEELHCDPNSIRQYYISTPLFLACKYDQLNVVAYLINECNCYLSPLQTMLIFSNRFVKEQTDVAIYLLSSQALTLFNSAKHKHILFQPALKVLVIGNSSSGKSTFIKALQITLEQEQSWLTKQYKRLLGSKLGEVESHTAGIIPVLIRTPSHNTIIIYDFAGQAEYYSSHAAVCEILSKDCLVLIVFDVSKHEEECIQELRYWKSFIDNQSKEPSIIVIASHADIVIQSQEQDAVQRAQRAVKIALGEKGYDSIIVTDCRLEASDHLETVSAVIKQRCTDYCQTFQHIDTKIHFCKHVIQANFDGELGCQVEKIMQIILSNKNSYLRTCDLLPRTIDELSCQLTILNESGECLYLKNKHNLRESWVILKKDVLLAGINGTIFAPENFIQHHHNISNNTGVVPLSKIRKMFPHYNPRMLIEFMTHLEFCHEIPESEARLISTQSNATNTNKRGIQGIDIPDSESEIFYFFPGLVNIEIPMDSRKTFLKSYCYKSGWSLQRSAPHKFLTSRFLHTLLLRVMFTFALECDRISYRSTASGEANDGIVIQRQCNVWRNGIHWVSDTGVETIVEVVNHSTAVIMVMRCLKGREMECILYRSRLIQSILQTKEQFSRAVEMREAFIDPQELNVYPLKNIESIITFSIDQIARTMISGKEVLTGKLGTHQEMIEISTLLHFEPFTFLTHKLITTLFDEENTDLDTSDDFLHDCARFCYPNINQLKKILIPLELESEYIGAVEQCHDQYHKDPVHRCFLVFMTWKNSTETPTYKILREALGRHSIFCGRNPLVSVQFNLAP